MYGPKKTPHFISKNQLLPFPNLAHLLKAQDQGGGGGLVIYLNFMFCIFTFLYCCICVFCIVFAAAPPDRPAPEWSGWKRAGEHPDTDQLAKLGPGSSKCSVFVPMCSQFCMYVLGI